MKSVKLVLLALAAAAAPGLTMAQTASNGMTYEQFNHIDADGSGTISEAEYRQFMERAYKELDKDGNNSLSRDETSQILSTQQFSQTDTNNDGRINRQEFLDQVMADFHRHDHDKDGQLTH